ncbi:MAG: S41 family peptidase [Dehalococcoidia bacterium]
MKPSPVSLRVPAPLLAALVLLAAVAAVGCRTADPPAARVDPQDTIATAAAEAPMAAPAPVIEPEAPPVAAIPAPPAGATPADSAQVIGQAYRELTTRLFREIRPSDLLSAGWRGVQDEARRQGQARSDQLQSFIDAGTGDIDAFTREFILFLNGPGAGLDAGRLAQAAIRGMATSVGDSHTRFVPAQVAERQDRLDGSYTGIGVVTGAGQTDGAQGLTIREVYAGSPADQAGLRAGDRIIRVNGSDVAGRTQLEVSEQIRGDAGTSVNLTVLDAVGQQRDVVVNRARILPPAIAAKMLTDGIGYLKVSQFPRRTSTRDAAAEFESALTALEASGARAYVLDLRGNPGGDPFTSVDIASNFVQEGPIFIAIDRNGRRTAYPANRSRKLVDAPVVVLIDGESASGAEVVASALSEYGAAHLIGQATCGCLSVGQATRLDDKSEIVVTVQQAVTGKLERSLEGKGLDPDEFIRTPRLGGPDTQLERATEYLQAQIS